MKNKTNLVGIKNNFEFQVSFELNVDIQTAVNNVRSQCECVRSIKYVTNYTGGMFLRERCQLCIMKKFKSNVMLPWFSKFRKTKFIVQMVELNIKLNTII